ncbi:MAG: polyprenyl synthetase family protein [Deltaproteobacteria bacterium]|nr:polyprenyl synthetase family protein [Deltaproteobacteria bacterium]
MQIQDVFNHYSEELNRVEEHMQMCLRSDVGLIHEIINHIIGSGGKRFRPLLLLAASGLCRYRGERRFPLSVVIEFVHTATLLHDDVIDHAKIRRGKTSANNIWGNAASVLVGDFLYSMSFKLMTADGNLNIMKLISATTNSMSEGEVFQLMKCGDTHITEAEYISIIEKKTSILISAACAVGGILGGAGETDIAALTNFGMRLGSAFQITDDTLDYMAKEEEFGKSVGQDFQEGKITLPLIRTLKNCSPAERKLIKKTIGKKKLTGENIADVISLIHKYDGAGYALNKARKYIDEGKEFLRHFRDSEDKAALLTISDYILERRL